MSGFSETKTTPIPTTASSTTTYYRSVFTRPASISLALFKFSSKAMQKGIDRNPFAHQEDDPTNSNPKPKCKHEYSRHKFAFCADCQQKVISPSQIAAEEEWSNKIQDEDHQVIVDLLSPNEGTMTITHSTLGAGILSRFCSTNSTEDNKMAIATFNCDPCDRRIKIPCSKLQEFTDSHAKRLHGLGVTIEWLLAFTFDHDCWHRPTWWVNRHIIKEATRHNRRRYMDLDEMKQYARPATVFMSHCWGSLWGDVVLAACHGARFGRVVWIDLFAVRQWGGSGADLNFRGVINKCVALVVSVSPVDGLKEMMWHEADRDAFLASAEGKAAQRRIPIFRLWCNVEIAAAYKIIPIVMKGGKAKAKTTSNSNNKTYIYDSKCVGDLMSNLVCMVDVEASNCEVTKDYEREMKIVRSLEGGIKGVNSLVAGVLNGAQSWVFNISEIDAFVCNEKEALRELYLPLLCQGEEERRLRLGVLYSACSGGHSAILHELLLKWTINDDDTSNIDLSNSSRKKKGIVYDENDGRSYFVCIDDYDVDCRNTPDLEDRCLESDDSDDDLVVYKYDCVVGTLTEDNKWICIVESDEEQQNGKFLPIISDEELLFEKITTKTEWINNEKQKSRQELVDLIDSSSVLCAASSGGHVQVVKMLLEVAGIDINVGGLEREEDMNNYDDACNVDGTPLYSASNFGHVNVVKLLLACKAIDVNRPTSDGVTPLLVACDNGHADVVQLLLAVDGIDINLSSTTKKYSPLYVSSFSGYDNIVKLLLGFRDIDVNQTVVDGQSSLFAAAASGHINVINLLLASGANINTRVKDLSSLDLKYSGLTALGIAKKNNYTNIVQLLLREVNDKSLNMIDS